jgi:hypothetical protein
MLVYEDYQFDPDHVRSEITPVIADVNECLTWKQFQNNSMDWILGHLKGNTKTWMKANREKVKKNAENLPTKEKFEMMADEIELKDTGAKWLVVRWGDVMCFAEEINNG